MCGIVGYSTPPNNRMDHTLIISSMMDELVDRGPDSSGRWHERDYSLNLGHTRLAIQDLSTHGKQPMLSRSQRYVLTYNGEIYNFKYLRRQLSAKGVCFIGNSDTEVILACVEFFGVEKTLQKITGMFAFALWDRVDRCLHIARDRVGEKPLYYGWLDRSFVFASDLSALKRHPLWKERVDHKALSMYVRFNYIPAPLSIFAGIKKLSPGYYLSVKPGQCRSEKIIQYWRYKQGNSQNHTTCSDLHLTKKLDAILTSTVSHQMISDVPLGCFLSGGIDSSLIAAMMSKVSPGTISTFTAGYDDKQYNESNHAAAVAQHLGTNHHEFTIKAEEALDLVHKLPHIFSEPFADASQIPSYLLANFSRKHIKVVLSGDGGDELFGGYNRYLWAPKIWKKISRLPIPMRIAATHILTCISPNTWDQLLNPAKILNHNFNQRLIGEKIHKLARVVSSPNQSIMYKNLVSQCQEPSELVLFCDEDVLSIENPEVWSKHSSFEQKMMYLDGTTYLPDDIMVKVDRSTMAVGLESRAPLLDHKVVEFSNGLPVHKKISSKASKWLLRQVLYQYIPRSLVDRPKMGFGIPIGEWLRGPLKSWGEKLLDDERIRQEGYFNSSYVTKLWQQHKSDNRNNQYELWGILMFQAWLENNG